MGLTVDLNCDLGEGAGLREEAAHVFKQQRARLAGGGEAAGWQGRRYIF